MRKGALQKLASMLLTPVPNEPEEHWLLRGLYVKILKFFYSQGYYSRTLANETKIPQEIIKPIVRELRLYGLITYQTAGFDEDGECYGSGHHITEAGRKYYREMRKHYEHINTGTAES